MKRYMPMAIAGLFLLSFPALTGEATLNLFVFGLITLITVLGLSLLFGYGGQISLGQAGFYGLGAYVSAYISTKLNLSPFIGLAAATAVPALLAYAIGRPILRLKGYYLAMVTAGIGIILHTAFVELEGFTGGYSGIPNIPPFRIGTLTFRDGLEAYYGVGACAVVFLAFALRIVNTPYGRAMRTMRESENAARSVGIDVAELKAQIFALSAGMSGFAGSLYAHYVGYISPESFTIDVSINLLLALMVGGVSSVWGATIGALIITFLPEWLHALQNAYGLVLGVFVVVLLTFEPRGLIGLISDGLFAVRSKAANRPDKAVRHG
jgi:branched-chain amino acid transport system permease protein